MTESAIHAVVSPLATYLLLAAFLAATNSASGQISGRPVAQPFFDYDWHARFDDCRWAPTYWGFDPFAVWDDDCDEETGECRTGFIAHRPSAWFAAADFVPLTYDPDAALPADLDPEFDSGMRITVGRTLWECYQVEGIYQGAYSWDDTAVDATTTRSSLFAAMETAELNFRTWLDLPPGPFDVSMLVGARYMNMHDDFRLPSDPFASRIRIQTDNELWGVQLGIDLKWLVHPRCYIDFDVKGAICDNDASLVTNDPVGGAGGDAKNRTAFIGDLLLTANWQMTPSLSIRAGYQAIFVTGVATGPDNLASNAALLDVGEPVQLDDSSEVVYHGPVLGVMWAR